MRELRRSLQMQIQACALNEQGRVLDLGCANKPYADLFPASVKYLGADLPGNERADVLIQDDGSVPLEANSVDLVLSTQVLEHLESPADYLKESFRLLKPGGWLVLSTHGLWIYHRDPVDYWRWTSDGLKLEISRVGFEIDRAQGLMGLAAVALQLFQDATFHHLPRFVARPYAVIWQRLIAMVDRLHSPQSRLNNAMIYLIVARKPLAPAGPGA